MLELQNLLIRHSIEQVPPVNEILEDYHQQEQDDDIEK